MRIRLVFSGRKAGAIGVGGFQVVDLDVPDGETLETMRMRAYDTHEHIAGGSDGVTVINLETGKAIKQ